VLAILANRFRDVDLADEAVQDGLVEALSAWERDGIPANPAGWLMTVARNRAIDRLRRAESANRQLMASAPELVASHHDDEEELIVDEITVRDEQLRLVLLCCHPALDRDTQVALTLRLVGGLTTDEIASAFVMPEPTLAQRIVRAKRKIREAGIPLTIPKDLEQRISVVLMVLYLVFNEGYLSRGSSAVLRVDLVDEAVRLTEQFVALVPDSPEARGLLALELFHRSRLSSRVDAAGELVLLEQQDRSTWDLAQIAAANRVLGSAVAARSPGPYQVQALIAAAHANARTAIDTDWAQIVKYYDMLTELDASPIVALNRAVAVAMADGAPAGLRALDAISGLDTYHLYWATRGELLLRVGSPTDAKTAFERALRLSQNAAERRHLEQRISAAS
jgi:RNA polymerase sigma-70 factor (ECF subfamily)